VAGFLAACAFFGTATFFGGGGGDSLGVGGGGSVCDQAS